MIFKKVKDIALLNSVKCTGAKKGDGLWTARLADVTVLKSVAKVGPTEKVTDKS